MTASVQHEPVPPRGLPASSCLPALLVVAACWPVAGWLLGRWFDRGASTLHPALFVFALGVWGYLLRRGVERAPVWFGAAAVSLTAYAALYTQVPGLVSSGLALGGLGCVMLGTLPADTRRGAWGLLALVMLALPLGPSLDFFCGYPLRVVVGKLAALMMMQTIEPVGAGLSDGLHTVFIDAPCSGVRMLVTSAVLASATALALRLSWGRTLTLIAFALVVAIFGNALRASSLFIVETNGLFGGAGHLPLGVSVFAACAAAVVWAGWWLEKGNDTATGKPVSAGKPRPVRLASVLLLTACALALGRSFVPVPGVAAESGNNPVAWPRTWNSVSLVPVPLEVDVERYLRAFPGQMAQFRLDGTGARVLLRRCTQATRALHPAEDCYRALGYTCEPIPAVQDEAGHLWSRFRVTRPDGSSSTVRQCYFAVDGEAAARDLDDWIVGASSWPDVSSWYWAAARPYSTVEATLAVTVSEDTRATSRVSHR
ncbi:MAG: hypothetical protein QG656_2694 [Candidatus Hydrogenedentes bacterium]|nr:hypothetical protein [Candidatus Hydrogenedentota bacterium]